MVFLNTVLGVMQIIAILVLTIFFIVAIRNELKKSKTIKNAKIEIDVDKITEATIKEIEKRQRIRGAMKSDHNRSNYK